MIGSGDLLALVYEALYGRLALGIEVIEDPLTRWVLNPKTPNVYDANHGTSVRASSPSEIDAVIARAAELFVASEHRRFFVDPSTPATFEARLALDGYELETEVTLLLDGDVAAAAPSPGALDIRLVASDDDWEAYERLLRLDYHEQFTVFGRLRSEELTHQLAVGKRAKSPAVRFWIARVEDTDCAFFSSWPGTGGVGVVEDLFTHAEFRHRGIATALIRHCVADARARGAGPVAITALIDDTPKEMYAALGFRPYCVNRSWLSGGSH